jgi:hypothetical protein
VENSKQLLAAKPSLNELALIQNTLVRVGSGMERLLPNHYPSYSKLQFYERLGNSDLEKEKKSNPARFNI